MLSDFTKFQSKLNGQDLELGLENAGSEEGVSLTKLTLVSRAPVAPEKNFTVV